MSATQGKAFVYLVQARGELPEHYSAIECARADLIRLTWKDKLDGAIYFPNSTWTEGRNRLLGEAIGRERRYLYYIFLDEDIVFERGDWRLFEEYLLKYRPAAAAPYSPWYPPSRNSRLEQEAHTCFYFDAMFSAFHGDIVADRIVLPYYPGYDAKSWWFSQWFVIHLMQLFFPHHVLQFNRVWTRNAEHAPYPHADNWQPAREFFDQVVRHHALSALPRFFRRVVQKIAPFRVPAKPLDSYRVPEWKKFRELNLNSRFWAK